MTLTLPPETSPERARPQSSRWWVMELSLLYVAEGLPFGFFAQGLPVLFRQHGASLPVVGLLTLLYLPWALKALWAPLVDSWHLPGLGRRRTWILLSQLGMVLCLVVAAWLAAEGGFRSVVPLVVVINLLAATQDIAVDGYAVSKLTPGLRGLGNAIQVCGYKVGMVVSGGALLAVADNVGWSTALLLLALCLALVTPVGARLKEPEETTPSTVKDHHAGWDVAQQAWSHMVTRPGARALLCLCVAIKMGEAGASAMLKPALVDRGFTLEDVAWWIGTWGLVASLAGSALGGWLATVTSRPRALVIAVLLQAAGIAGIAWLVGAPPHWLGWASVVEHLVTGILTTVLFTFMMDAVDPRFGGTEYTILASAVVVGTGLAGILGGWIAEHAGYQPLFMGGAVFTVLSLLLVPAANGARRISSVEE